MSITPTVGRIVYYTPGKLSGDVAMVRNGEQPLAAIVVAVWSETCVNLRIFDANGNSHIRTSVLLVQDGNPKPDGGFCEWMPYQLAQAAKAETAPAPEAPAAHVPAAPVAEAEKPAEVVEQTAAEQPVQDVEYHPV